MDRFSGEFEDVNGGGDIRHVPQIADSADLLPDRVANYPSADTTAETRAAYQPLGELPPDQQNAYLYQQAVASAAAITPRRGLGAKVYASRLLLPDDSEAAHGLYSEVAALPLESAERAKMMATLSKKIGMDEAWHEALKSAAAIDVPEHSEEPPVLAEIVAGELEATRLGNALRTADANYERTPRAIVAKAVVKQHLAAGRLEQALGVSDTMPFSGLAGIERDEATLHIVDALAGEGRIGEAHDLLYRTGASVPMTAWGSIKLAKHDQSINIHLPNLAVAWRFFNVRQRSEFVQDLVDGQHIDEAYELARRISMPESPALADKEAQTVSIINIARTVASSDANKAMAILQELWENSALNIERHLDGSQFKGSQHIELAIQSAGFADRATIELISLAYRDNPHGVLEAIQDARYLTEQPELHQAIACATVARDLALAGNIYDAVRIASEIPGYASLGVMKSKTFTNIGLGMRAWREGLTWEQATA